MKDAGMHIRVEQELKDAFVAVCQKMDITAVQVLRQHKRVVVAKAEKNRSKS